MNLQQKIKSLKNDLIKLEEKYNVKFDNPEIKFYGISVEEITSYEDEKLKEEIRKEVKSEISESVWKSVSNTLDDYCSDVFSYITKINL